MGSHELIGSLRKTADERIAALWRDAEAEAERIRDHAGEQAGRLREELDRRKADAALCDEERAVSAARATARTIRLEAERHAADRLFAEARASLRSALAPVSLNGAFTALAAELPLISWSRVRVHPEDEEIARVTFPTAEIVPDAAISGGVEAEAADGTVLVVNTLEKRLERAWPELLPLMMKDLNDRFTEDGPAGSAP